MKIVTSYEMRRIESRSERAGVSTDTLMENAGLAVAKRVRHQLGRLVGAPMLFLIGPGNNGGDGLVAARHLHAWGARPTVCLSLGRKPDDHNLAILQSQSVPVFNASDGKGLLRLRSALKSAQMVIDAILGTGRSRPIGGVLKDVLLELAHVQADRPDMQILALDLPTGLDADTGAVDPVGVAADVTVTLGYPKVGLYRFPGAERTGRIETVDIGIPDGLDDDIWLELMTADWARATLPPRPLDSHKGTFGKALVVAGSRNYVGAASLAATAAGRCGAGLVTLAIPESLQMAVASAAVEPTYIPLPESARGVPSSDAANHILENVAGYDSLLVGCGMGQAPATHEMLERLLYSGADLPPIVVDADGLNSLARSQEPGWWERFSDDAIVTPHPGEMGRLDSSASGELRRERVRNARDAAMKWNKVVVLKGAHTVVADPSGSVMLSPFANPGLASAGTGDVLAGAIVGLLAQGLGLYDAAALGVYLHGLAGECLRSELGNTGMLASDLLPKLPRMIKELRGYRG